MYATASYALPRDIAQALLRARVIKSNRLWFCIEERCVKHDITRRRDLICDTANVGWEAAPDWATELIARNENEIAVSRRHFGLVLKRYLRASGYTLMKSDVAEELFEVEMQAEIKPVFESIRDLTDDEADCISDRGSEATREDKVALLKYRVVRKFVDNEEGRSLAADIWNTMFIPAEGKKPTLETKFWNIVHEKQRDLGRAWREEASSNYAEQAKVGILRQSVIKELCGIVGLEHSCAEKSWSHSEFSEIAPRILAIEEKLRKALGLRPYRGKYKESEFHSASDILKQALASWSETDLEKKVSQKTRKWGC